MSNNHCLSEYQDIRIPGYYDIKQVQDIVITESGYHRIYQGITIVICGYQRIYLGIRMVIGISGYQGIRLSGIRVSGYQGIRVFWYSVLTAMKLMSHESVPSVPFTPSVSILLSSF